jgi:hypothetical protein
LSDFVDTLIVTSKERQIVIGGASRPGPAPGFPVGLSGICYTFQLSGSITSGLGC